MYWKCQLSTRENIPTTTQSRPQILRYFCPADGAEIPPSLYKRIAASGNEIDNNVLNPSAERLQTAKIALHFTERPLTSVVTLFFPGSYEKLSFRRE